VEAPPFTFRIEMIGVCFYRPSFPYPNFEWTL
jgi:hypothetical protein